MPPALADLTTLRLGGPAGRLVEAADEAAIVAAVRAADAAGTPLLILAGGSNLVVADAGFPGTVLRIVSRGVREDGDRLTVAAGEPWDPFVARCVAEGRAGVECLAGIPGSVGATPIQNVGAYGQEVAETIVSVRVYDRARRTPCSELPAAECGFSYRSSRVQAHARPLGRARRRRSTCRARPARARCATPSWPGRSGSPRAQTAPLADVRGAVLALRRGKGMVIDPADPGLRVRRLVLHEPGARSRRVRRAARRGRGRGSARTCACRASRRPTGRSRRRRRG